MAIRPKTVTKARGVGTAQAVRESVSDSPAAAHKYVSFNAPEKTARIIGLAAQLEGESLKDYCISLTTACVPKHSEAERNRPGESLADHA